MDGLHFSLSDRLRNCRGAATTPSQSVTATAFPCHRTARGLLLVFFANTTASTTPPFIPFSSVCSGQTKVAYLHFTFACSRAGYVTEIKTPPIWLQAQADLRLYIKSTDIIYLGCDCMKTH